VQWEDIMAKLLRPEAPGVFRALFPGLADWLESPWAGPPQFTAAQSFRVEEVARDNRHVIRAELPGLDPESDIEVTVEGRTLTIHAERRQEDSGPYRSEFRYGSLTRLVTLPGKVDAKDVTARYHRGVLEVSVPAPEVRPEGDRVAIEDADCAQPAPREGRNRPARRTHGHRAAPGEGPP
jgi:HSP20 family protein